MNTDLVSYYRDRAKEYESIYEKPERQADLSEATNILQTIFRGENVLEIACGTGYWTERLAPVTTSIFATDINETVIEIASKKDYHDAVVRFAVDDLFRYKPMKKYDGVFGGFIWSHIPLQELDEFLQKVISFVEPGGLVVFMDNNYVDGSNTAIFKTDQFGNTYQNRKLKDGSEHLVLKNFATEEFVRKALNGLVSELNFCNMEYYWIVICRVGIE